MSWNARGEWIPEYVYTQHPAEGRSDGRMYHFESGCMPWGEKDEDGVTWYRIQTSYWFGDWIETQDKNLWRTHGGRHRAIYIVREELMTLIQLKWL